MILIGMVLADGQKGSFFDRDILTYTLLRLGLMPGGMFLVCKLLGMDTVLAGTAVLLTGMPAGTLSVMLGAKYGSDAPFASRLVIFTTVLSLATIPLWCLACVYLI